MTRLFFSSAPIRILILLAFNAALNAVTNPAAGQSIIHVSPTQGSLQDALDAVTEGGVIELESGTYAAPSEGWTITSSSNGPRGFVVRAANGAAAVLDGGGLNEILSSVTPQPVTFQGLTFANGVSTRDYRAGGISLDHAQASFVACTFQNNAAVGSVTGGGALWIASSVVSFQSCTWINNSSKHYGGAFSAEQSRVYVRDSQFMANRVNLPGHAVFSAGGAIHGNASTIHLDTTRFEGNQAGYVGGAIYVYGPWHDPVNTPNMELVANNCLFVSNFTRRDPSGTQTASTSGGAIQLEDQTKGSFHYCRFIDNSAQQGGAIASYRSESLFQGCSFLDNSALGSMGPEGLGGAIFVLSDDNSDPSTIGGTINRPSAKLALSDCLIRGPGNGAFSARQGGGVFAGGDLHSMYGQGVNQNGTADMNRAAVSLVRVVFSDLATSDALGNGTGGALTGAFITLNMNQCIVRNCGASQFGGAVELVRSCRATLTNTALFGNVAGLSGGALTVFGGDLTMTNCSLINNRITGGFGGDTITTVPDVGEITIPPSEMTGVIQNCVVIASPGTQPLVYDGYRFSDPVNRLQFKANQFYPANENTFFFDTIGFRSVTQVNGLTLTFADNSTCVKAPVPNSAPVAIPITGAILMVPPTASAVGAPGETLPISACVAYSSGGGIPSLDGVTQTTASGIAPTLSSGAHNLQVGSTTFSTVPLAGMALNISTRLPVGIDQDVLIGGFILQGPVTKRIMIRAIGPSLSVSGPLLDPVLELHDATGVTIASNDDWRSTELGGLLSSSQSIDIQASALAPAHDTESAIIAVLDPGAYTAVVRGASNTTGVAVVEGYDLGADQSSKLANISTRGLVQLDDSVMIGGFILQGGNSSTKVVVRGIGPSLSAIGVTNPLLDPTMELRDANGAVIDANDDWRSNQASIIATGLQPTDDRESALLLTEPLPGAYTAILRGKNGGTGVGVVEVYLL